MNELVTVTKALADETRLRILGALAGQELCLCQLTAIFDATPSTISTHCGILKRAHLVECRKEGRWHYYRTAGPGAPPMVRDALRWVREALRDNPQSRSDAQRLRAVTAVSAEELCRRRNGS